MGHLSEKLRLFSSGQVHLITSIDERGRTGFLVRLNTPSWYVLELMSVAEQLEGSFGISL